MAILIDDAYLKKSYRESVPVIFNEEISDVSAIVVNGALYQAGIDNIDAEKIESIEVKKMESLTGEELEKCKLLGKKAVVYITLKKDDSKPSEAIFTACEKAPEFPGGTQAMMKYLQSNIRYPKAARDLGTQGKAYVQFVVMSDGSVENVEILKKDYSTQPLKGMLLKRDKDVTMVGEKNGNVLSKISVLAYRDKEGKEYTLEEVRELEKGATAALDAEAIRVVASMPKWTPGMQNGKAVNVRFTLPVMFALQ